MMLPTHRFHELDLLRGIACASVIGFHYLSRSPRVGWMSDALYPFLEGVTRYGYLGVHLFFVISGFVILLSVQNATAREFLASRVARLYPAFWTAATITAFTAWLLSDNRFSVSLGCYLVNLTMVPHWFNLPYVDGAYWSLAVELHFYIYVLIVLHFKQMHRIEWLMTAWLAISTANAIHPAYPIEFWLNAKWAPLFVAGGTLFLIRTRGLNGQRTGLLLISYMLSIFYAVSDTIHYYNILESVSINPWIVALIITSIFFTFLIIAADRWRISRTKITDLLGKLTYPAYLVHQVFGAMIYQALRTIIDSSPLALAITTFIVLLISQAIHSNIELIVAPHLKNIIKTKKL